MASDQAPIHGGHLALTDPDSAAPKWRTGVVAASILGTHYPRFRRFRTTCRIHSFQSGQAWSCLACPRLAFLLVSSICATRLAARRLGWRSRSPSRKLRRAALLTPDFAALNPGYED